LTTARIDLAISPSAALQEGFVTALPYIGALAVIAVLAWYQQRQIMGRNKHSEVSDQQKMMMRIGPAFQIFFAFISPAAVGIYFLVSTTWRVAQQSYITHSLYSGEDSLGVQAQKAMAEARAEKKKAGGNGASAKGGTPARRPKAGTAASSTNGAQTSGSSKRKAGSQAQTTGSGTSRATAHPRSRKKKKRK
jgi:hypothetical protein